MKTKTAAAFLAAITLSVACAACGNAAPPPNLQHLNYEESTAAISNPDQGFYRPLYVKFGKDGISYNKSVINDATQLYHLRCDISEFSAAVNGQADIPLTQDAVSDFDSLLTYLKENDKNAVVRFAYDSGFNGNKNFEPTLDTMLYHVRQVCSVLDRYATTVTAIETGLIGPWGEMHTSAVANAEHISPIIDAFLTNTESTPVSVRTPKMIYDYLELDAEDINDYTVAPTEKAYRLSLYNDGYLGSDSDLGTYADRQRDISFLSRQTSHLPFGGEVTIPDSTLHNIEKCLPEMNEIHLSYLNVEWDNRVIDKWKNSYYTKDCGTDKLYYGETAFRYIENHMGYRFVLKSSELSYSADSGALNAKLKLQNVGFGNLNKKKHAAIILTDASGAVATAMDVEDFTGDVDIEYKAATESINGKYDVYLRLYGEEMQGVPLYCVRFANDGLWNAELKANKIGSIEYTVQPGAAQ